MTAIETVLEKLRAITTVRESGGTWQAQCPAHSDQAPSLSITASGKKVLLKCHAGCDTQDILARAGLEWEALFDEPLEKGARPEKVAEYVYQRPDGTPYMVVERWREPNGKKSFRQRMAGADRYGLGDNKPCLYRLPRVMAQARAIGTIYLVEGEKDVHACEMAGLVATTAPMGAGAWRAYYADWLHGCSKVIIVVDDDDAGHKHAAAVCAELRAREIPVETVLPANGNKDAFDHFASGAGVEDFRKINLNRLRPEGVGHKALTSKKFPPLRYAIDGLLPSGLAILGGAPKCGKSYVALDIALGVAYGGKAMSSLTCNQGSVLYLSLDNDSERRLQERVSFLLQGEGAPEDLPIEYHLTYPTNTSALAACQEWVNETENPLLIVVDTLIRVEPGLDSRESTGSAYSHGTSLLAPWADLATRNNVCVLALHHSRKDSAGGDWMDWMMGTRSITATAQTLLMLQTKRHDPSGTLHVDGRDVEPSELDLRKTGRVWIAETVPRAQMLGTVAVEVLEYVAHVNAAGRDASVDDIRAQFPNLPDWKIWKVLSDSVKSGRAVRTGNGYYNIP